MYAYYTFCYVCTKMRFRRILVTLRTAHLGELRQRMFVILRAAYFESCSSRGIESRTVVDKDLRSFSNNRTIVDGDTVENTYYAVDPVVRSALCPSNQNPLKARWTS